MIGASGCGHRRSRRGHNAAGAGACSTAPTIALGIGSNAAVYGFVRGLSAPLALPGGDRIVSLFARDAHDGFRPFSYDEYLSVKAQAGALDAIGAVRESHASITIDGQSSIVSVASITAEAGALLGVPLETAS